MPVAEQFKILGVYVRHPGVSERLNGEGSEAHMTISRNLKSGRVDDIPLTSAQLLKLIGQAAHALEILGHHGA